MPKNSVIADALSFLLVICLVTGVVILCNRLLVRYYIVPIALLCVHVYGNTVQEYKVGPVWIQEHLHNAGVAGLSLMLAAGRTLYAYTFKFREQPLPMCRYKATQTAMRYVLYYWIAATLYGISIEVASVTIWRSDSMAHGYSGQLDWYDLLSYFVGAAIISANHAYFTRPRVLAKLLAT